MSLVVFGSANADLLFRLPRLPAPGETVLGDAGAAMPGGKGLNQAIAAARAGAVVQFAGCIGADANGAMLRAALLTAGVGTDMLLEVPAPTGMAAVLVDPNGQNQIAVSTGANACAAPSQVPDEALLPGGALLLQMEVPPAANAALIARARRRGVRTILNLAPATPMPALPDMLILNEPEAAFLATMLGCAGDAVALQATLGCTVLRTLGPAGAEAATGNDAFLVPAFQVIVADSVGAGDAWSGALAAALLSGAQLAGAMRQANAAGALACMRPGVHAPSLIEIKSLLKA